MGVQLDVEGLDAYISILSQYIVFTLKQMGKDAVLSLSSGMVQRYTGISMWREGHDVHTVKLLQDSFHGAGTAAAAHGDVELVLVVGHSGLGALRCWNECCKSGFWAARRGFKKMKLKSCDLVAVF